MRAQSLPGMCAAGALLFLVPTPARADDDALAGIRRLYAKVEAAKPLSTRKIEFVAEAGLMEGSITYRIHSDGLSYTKLSYIAGDHGSADEHYYYGPDGLFFIFAETYHWRFGPPVVDGDPTTIDSLTEKRYYFRDGSCFHAFTRSAESADEKKLKGIASKVPNKVFDPGKEARNLFKRALALRGITTAKEAERYFQAEWEAP